MSLEDILAFYIEHGPGTPEQNEDVCVRCVDEAYLDALHDGYEWGFSSGVKSVLDPAPPFEREGELRL